MTPAPTVPLDLRALFVDVDGQLYLSSGGATPKRLTWTPEDFAVGGMPVLPELLGDLAAARVFAHACPSPDGSRVAVFAMRPAVEEDIEIEGEAAAWEAAWLLNLDPDASSFPDDVAGPGFVSPDSGETPDASQEATFWPGATVYLLDRSGEQVSEVWSFEDGLPTHLEWAPDGRHLLVLHQQSDWLHLHLVDTEHPGQAERLVSGAPIFWSWQPGGRRLAVRAQEPGVGRARLLVGAPLDGVPLTAAADAGRFYAPAWHPDGSSLLIGVAGAMEDELILADSSGRRLSGLLGYPGRAAFQWDPSGRHAAVAIAPQGDGAFDILEIVDVADDSLRPLWRGPFVAFRWLPDGERLLLCTASPDGEGLRWVLLDLQGEAHPVGPAFTPAQECFIALHFFEQVGISHPFLSADGKHVIFAGHCAEAVPGVPEGEGPDSHVFVTDLGSGSTVSVGRGRFACLF